MKKVLVISYTQTGQLHDILEHLLGPLKQVEDIAITHHIIQTETTYPYPWPKERFFDVFPESALGIPDKLKPIDRTILEGDYDLVILGYQVWFLSPSIPFNSFLMSEEGRCLLQGKPVITVIGCRNMWFTAQENVKRQLLEAEANLIGNIVFVDRHVNHVSLITIVRWLIGGKTDRYLGIFPKPGVSGKDIREASKFAQPIIDGLRKGNFNDLQPALGALGAVMVRPLLVFIDKRGSFIFSKFSRKIRAKGLPGDPARRPLLKFFNYYLLFALWVIAPIVSLSFLILHLPFIFWVNREKRYLQSVRYNGRL